jgi:hypothetical protein
MTCPKKAHVHKVTAIVHLFGLTFVSNFGVFDEQRNIMLITTERAHAERIAELINRHGLADVPDSPATLISPWPAPSGPPAS